MEWLNLGPVLHRKNKTRISVPKCNNENSWNECNNNNNVIVNNSNNNNVIVNIDLQVDELKTAAGSNMSDDVILDGCLHDSAWMKYVRFTKSFCFALVTSFKIILMPSLRFCAVVNRPHIQLYCENCWDTHN